MQETETSEKDRASREFSRLIDAASEFVKAIFPYGYDLSQDLNKRKAQPEESDKEEVGKIVEKPKDA